jgi:hypothetical protein
MSDLKFYSAREAADLLRLTEGTLRNWRNKRVGPAFVKFGTRVLYSEDALAEYAKSCAMPALQSPTSSRARKR